MNIQMAVELLYTLYFDRQTSILNINEVQESPTMALDDSKDCKQCPVCETWELYIITTMEMPRAFLQALKSKEPVCFSKFKSVFDAC